MHSELILLLSRLRLFKKYQPQKFILNGINDIIVISQINLDEAIFTSYFQLQDDSNKLVGMASFNLIIHIEIGMSNIIIKIRYINYFLKSISFIA